MSKEKYSDYIKQYNNFIDQLKIIYTESDTRDYLSIINNYTDDDKISRGVLFNSLLNEETFDLFLKSKIKVFSHKNNNSQLFSESLFGTDFCLKNLLNNQSDDIKKLIWYHLHSIFLSLENVKPVESQNNIYIQKLNELVLDNNAISNSKQTLQDILGVEVNTSTTEMIDDIVESFEKILSNPSGNPLSGIMEISQKISVKYADKINNGDIELEKIMETFSTKIPGLDKMMGNLTGNKGLSSLLSGFMGGSQPIPQEKIIIDENFSTANVELGLNKLPESSEGGFKLSDMLKIAGSMGILPNGSNDAGVTNASGMPDMSSIMNFMSSLQTGESSGFTAGDDLQKQVTSFLQNDMGLDINQLNTPLEGSASNLQK
jgi:hypothetical protein